MSNLLSSGFSRLWKNKLFWLCIIFNIGFSCVLCTDRHTAKVEYGYEETIDSIFYAYAPVMMMIIIPMFTTLFIGTEYSDGTIRNKFIIGHSRLSIYLSNLIVCSAANILISAAAILTSIAVGFPLLGFFNMPIKNALYLTLCTFLADISMTALVTLIAMLIQNKAGSAVASIVIALALLMTTSIIYERLNEPELQTNYIYMDENGEIQPGDPAPNPLYVSGTTRAVLEFTNDFIPSGQSIQVSNLDVERSSRWWYFSLILTAAAVGAGFEFFRRKDIR